MIIPDWNAPSHITAFTTICTDLPEVYVELEQNLCLNQVHGTQVITLPLMDSGRITGDAVVTRSPNTLCAVRTADCLPILIRNQQGTEVAAIHAGWRGLAAGVIEASFKYIHTPPAECIAWIGPAICLNCFEIGPEVRDTFLLKNDAFHVAFRKAHGLKWQANLSRIAEMILYDQGVRQIFQSHICSVEDLRCHSYRRDKGTLARMISGISFEIPALMKL